MTVKKVVVLGSGQLAQAFMAAFKTRRDFYDPLLLPRRFLSLSYDMQEELALLDCLKPEILINCAAYTDVDKAEDEPHWAYRVNAMAPGILAHWCRRNAQIFVHFSTDFVFGDSDVKYHPGDPGKPMTFHEESSTTPMNVYGESKLAGEKAVLSAMYHSPAPDEVTNCFVVRTSSLWTDPNISQNNFPAKIIAKLRKMETCKVLDGGQYMSPTYAPDLAAGVLDGLLYPHVAHKAPVNSRPRFGIYHLTNHGACTWFEFAKLVAAEVGLGIDKIEPVDEYKTKAKRPSYSSLCFAKFLSYTHKPLPSLRDSIRAGLKGV